MMLNLRPSPDDVAPRRPRGGAARKARYRKRQVCGVVSVPVEVDAAVVDFLIRTEWLTEREAADRRAVGAAVSRVLKDSAARR